MSRYDLAAARGVRERISDTYTGLSGAQWRILDQVFEDSRSLAEIRQLLGCPEGGEVAAVRRLMGDARDPAHCYTCDRPTADCACELEAMQADGRRADFDHYGGAPTNEITNEITTAENLAEVVDIMAALKASIAAMKK